LYSTESNQWNWRWIFQGQGSSEGSFPPCLAFRRNDSSWHPLAEDITTLPVKVLGLHLVSIPNAEGEKWHGWIVVHFRSTWSWDGQLALIWITKWRSSKLKEAAQLLCLIKDTEITRTKLLGEGKNMSKKDGCIIGHGPKTGGWLIVLPNVIMNRSILSNLKFWDCLHLCYAMT
jgi:hypothetical protein